MEALPKFNAAGDPEAFPNASFSVHSGDITEPQPQKNVVTVSLYRRKNLDRPFNEYGSK
jgi:hypothetical protein